MKDLKVIEINKRGDRIRLVRRENDGTCDLLAFAWMDRERTYFICSESNILERLPNIRSRRRQESEKLNTEPENLTLVIDQSKACELHYTSCAMVDHHNCCRMVDL